MANSAWSNDQLNAIMVYDAATGTLILQIDSTQLFYENIANGSYFKVAISPYPQDNGGVGIFLEPGASSVPGVVYEKPGQIISSEFVTTTPGKVYGEIAFTSPRLPGKVAAEIDLYSQSNTSATDDSEIDLFAANLFGVYSNIIGLGTFDEGGLYTTPTFTGTEIAADFMHEVAGVMSTTRRYKATWFGTAVSTTASDRIGLRIYTGPNSNNLTGATLICDLGQVTVPASGVGVPFAVQTTLNGVPGKYILLAARRASGSGTCSLNISSYQGFDVGNSY